MKRAGRAAPAIEPLVGDERRARAAAGVLVAALAAGSCSRADRAVDAAPDAAPAPPVASGVRTAPAAPDAGPPSPASPIAGEWERQTEPYRGMRVAIATPATRAIVTSAPPVTDERIEAQSRRTSRAVAKAQLECQRSLWRAGEELIDGIHPAGDGAFEATVLVRDWGLSGACRHVDARAPARLTIGADGELRVAVTRGKTVTQTWTRVGNAPAPR